MSKIVPVSDHVVVKASTAEAQTASGIFSPDTASKEKPMQGEVIAVGPGKMTENGSRLEMDVKVGDTILFSKYGPNEVKVEGEEYLILSNSDIYAIIQ